MGDPGGSISIGIPRGFISEVVMWGHAVGILPDGTIQDSWGSRMDSEQGVASSSGESEYGGLLPRRDQVEGLAEDLAAKLASLFGVDVPKIRGLFELLNETEESFEITFTIRLPKRKG